MACLVLLDDFAFPCSNISGRCHQALPMYPRLRLLLHPAHMAPPSPSCLHCDRFLLSSSYSASRSSFLACPLSYFRKLPACLVWSHEMVPSSDGHDIQFANPKSSDLGLRSGFIASSYLEMIRHSTWYHDCVALQGEWYSGIVKAEWTNLGKSAPSI
jgi:hypothetical protein